MWAHIYADVMNPYMLVSRARRSGSDWPEDPEDDDPEERDDDPYDD